MKLRNLGFALLLTSMSLAACVEVRSDHIIGRPSHGIVAGSSDTTTWDDAQYLEGLWTGIPIHGDDNTVYHVKHVAPAQIEIAWLEWQEDDFQKYRTEGVLSSLGGDKYLNIRPVEADGFVDTLTYWFFRLNEVDGFSLLYPPDGSWLSDEAEVGRIDATIDTLEDGPRVRLHNKTQIDSLIGALDLSFWGVDEPLALQRIMDVPD